MWHEQMENQGQDFRWLAPLSPAPQQEEKEDLLAQIVVAFRLPDLLEMLPTSVKRLTLVVDDILHALPWGGLSWDNTFLIERYALSFRFSAGVPDTKARVKDRYFLLGATETQGMPPLPGVEKEVMVINDLWQKDEKKSIYKWVNKAFTKPALHNAMESAHVVHLACHGTFDTADPGNSGIILPDGERYSLREILNQQHRIAIDHLTLSSCWAADQYILPGRWVISLPEVFYQIGAGSILASLWEVEDQWSVAFVNTFYEKAERLPRDLAFQEALMESMGGKSYSEKRKNISRWSGMQLFGSQLEPL
jgi:CHAT domain-containing protein